MLEKIEIHDRSVDARRGRVSDWNISHQDKKDIQRFLDELELGKVNKGRKVSVSRQSKYLDILRVPLEFIGKPVSKFTLKDIEEFEKALSSGKIKSNKKTAYSASTKVDLRRGLKVYLKWKLGSTKANKLTDWLDTRDVVKTPEYLKESEVEKLYNACKSADERFFIAILFDSGARAEEFHNIRYEDVNLPEKGKNYPKITLKEEYSKTKGRTVSLYWKYSLGAVREFLRERENEGIKNGEPVFNKPYENMRQFLVRLGNRVLGRPVHYHLFRHSSATHYAPVLKNRQKLCYRYGWTFSSRMPDTYISRAGMENDELDEQMTNTELSDIKTQLEKEKQSKEMAVDELQKEIDSLKDKMQTVSVIRTSAHDEVKELREMLNKIAKAQGIELPKKR